MNVDFPTEQEDVSIYISFLSNPETNLPYAWYVFIIDFIFTVKFLLNFYIYCILLLRLYIIINNSLVLLILTTTFCRAVLVDDAEHGSTFTCGEDIYTLVILLSNAFQVVHEVNIFKKQNLFFPTKVEYQYSYSNKLHE